MIEAHGLAQPVYAGRVADPLLPLAEPVQAERVADPLLPFAEIPLPLAFLRQKLPAGQARLPAPQRASHPSGRDRVFSPRTAGVFKKLVIDPLPFRIGSGPLFMPGKPVRELLVTGSTLMAPQEMFEDEVALADRPIGSRPRCRLSKKTVGDFSSRPATGDRSPGARESREAGASPAWPNPTGSQYRQPDFWCFFWPRIFAETPA